MKELLKKALAITSSILTAGLLIVSPMSLSAASQRNGDTNGDGKISLMDVVNICKHIIKNPLLTGNNLIQADYNRDGKVSLSDAVAVSTLNMSEKNIEEVVRLINVKRSKSGLPKLTIDYNMVDASMLRASEVPQQVKKIWNSNYRPDNSYYKTIFDEYGIEYNNCENCIAAGPATANELYNALTDKNSKARSKILDSKYTRIGVGYYYVNNEYKHYWAVLLAD